MSISLLFAIRRRWPLLVVLPILAAVVTFMLPSPRAVAQVSYQASEVVDVDLGLGSITQVEKSLLLLSQPDIVEAAIERYGDPGGDARTFTSRISAVPDPESFSVAFSARGADPDEVERYVEAVTSAFVEVENARYLEDFTNRVEAAQENYDAARAELLAFREENALGLAVPAPDPLLVQELNRLTGRADTTAQALDAAREEKASAVVPYRLLGVTPASRVADARLNVPQSRTTRAILGGLLGVVLAVVLAALIERFNPRMDDRRITEKVAGVPVLAMVPLVSRRQWPRYARVRPSEFNGPFAEAYRALRSHLDFLDNAGVGKRTEKGSVTAIVSPAPSEGKTVTASYLALAYQEAGADVVLLGCDYRKPAVHGMFEMDVAPGITSRRDPHLRLDLVDLVQRDPLTGISVVPSGKPSSHTTDLVPDVRALAVAAREAGRRVVIDTAPILVANDAIDLLGFVDHVVLVVRAGKTSRRSTEEAMINLRLNEATVAGAVMIGSLEASESSGYYYGYYAGAEASDLRIPFGPVTNGSAAPANGSAHGDAGAPSGEVHEAVPD